MANLNAILRERLGDTVPPWACCGSMATGCERIDRLLAKLDEAKTVDEKRVAVSEWVKWNAGHFEVYC